MENSVREFVTEHPDADYAAIAGWFGVPEKIAESYVTEMPEKDIVQHLRYSEKIFHCVVITSFIIVFLWLGVVSVAMRKHDDAMVEYYTEEIAVLEEIQYDGGIENETND